MAINFPITVKSIKGEEGNPSRFRKGWDGNCGDFVSIRPCAEQYGGKTYLGVLLGDMALSVGCSFNKETGELTLQHGFYNPAIFVPDLNTVIFGCESWWGQIESPEKLREITDDTIDNVWYVQALKALAKQPKPILIFAGTVYQAAEFCASRKINYKQQQAITGLESLHGCQDGTLVKVGTWYTRPDQDEIFAYCQSHNITVITEADFSEEK